MFARQAVFEDGLHNNASLLNNSKQLKQSSAGASTSGDSCKPKRKALANITNSRAKGNASIGNAKSNSLQEAAKQPTTLPSVAICADGHLDSPEKLAGPSATEQEECETKAEDAQLEHMVQRILRAIEGAPEDGICDISRDDDDMLQCIYDSGPDEAQMPCDLFNTLPDMQAPNFLDLLE